MLVFSIATVFLISAHATAFQPTVSNLSSNTNGTEDFHKSISGESGSGSCKLLSSFCLSEDTAPKAYNLKLIPNLQTFQVIGEIIIEVQIRNATDAITLHAAPSLNISSISISRENNEENITITSFMVDPETQQLRITASPILTENNMYRLHINFHYYLNNESPEGFFRAEYQDGDINKSYAITQFEPLYARMAFPCYDEPGFKTPFNISLARYRHEISRSNMPLKSISEPDPSIDNRVWDTYQTTPPMPTYLVAFMVSELASISEPNKKFTTFARKDMINDTRYALEEAQVLLKEMEKYIGVNYSLPKIDLVAVLYPSLDVSTFDAMENWGFVTFEENLLVTSPDFCPAWTIEQTTTLIAHEFAHQWFGNIVTPTWWSYLWLSEGFAQYFTYFLTAVVKPSWRMDLYFVVSSMQSVLCYEVNVPDDEYEHALNADIREQEHTEAIFDVITYHKGASIIRMLEHMITSTVFRRALNKYIIDGRNKEGSVIPFDLWNAVEKQVNRDQIKLNLPSMTITTIMKTWTDQMGYPLVTVSREKGTKNVIIRQESYSAKWNNTEWIIPLTYTTQSSNKFNDTFPVKWLLPGENVTLEVNENEWIILNLQQTGYYRVNYDPDNWQLLINQLNTNPQRIHALNRAQLLNDCFFLSSDHKVELTLCTQLMNYLKKETDIIPWYPALQILKILSDSLINDAENSDSSVNKTALREDIYSILDTQFNRLGFYPTQNDSHLIRTGRTQFLEFACDINYTACVQSAIEEYKKKENNLTKIDPELKLVVLKTMLQQTKGKEQEHICRAVQILHRNTRKLCEETIYDSLLKNCSFRSLDNDLNITSNELRNVSNISSLRSDGNNVRSQVMRKMPLKNGTDKFRTKRINRTLREELKNGFATQSKIFAARMNPRAKEASQSGYL